MRTTIGILGILGIGVTVAVAQQPIAPPIQQRAATLLPPIPLDPQDTPVVVRGVADDSPSATNSTPVNTPRYSQSLWSNTSDPNIRPAGGIGNNAPVGSVTPPAIPSNDDSSGLSRGFDKLKGAFGSGTPTGTADGKEQPNANTPYRGTTASGSTVYAGPPAYRWYGWGSPTPGTNPNAPTGQYPKISANWYSITGATPGALPVPVTNPPRSPSATEPPAYVMTSPARSAPGTYGPQTISTQGPAQPPASVPTIAELPRQNAQIENKSPVLLPSPISHYADSIPPPASLIPAPIPPAAPANPVANIHPPTITAPPSPNALMPPLPIPQVPAKPQTPSENSPAATQSSLPTALPQSPALFIDQSKPSSDVPQAITMVPTIPSIPLQPGDPTKATTNQKTGFSEDSTGSNATSAPAALPVSLTEYQLNWQRTAETATQGEWTTPGKPRPTVPATTHAPGAAPTTPSIPTQAPASANTPVQNPAPAPAPAPVTAPVPTPQTEPAPNWQQPGATDSSRPQTIARGQIGEEAPDPIVTLVRRMCEGRAEGCEVRWTGSKRISVCFECRNVSDAQRLVRDISTRPEFTPIRIDFCVLVK